MTTQPGNKADILEKFKLFEGGTGGLDSWLRTETPDQVFNALADLSTEPLSRERLNQLLTLAHEAPISQPLFAYYWLSAPDHPYDVRRIPGYSERWVNSRHISSIDHLYWGLYRFYVDALLFFGSIRTAYQQLRELTADELCSLFKGHMTEGLNERGEALPLVDIAKDNRYLISEMACKSYDVVGTSPTDASEIEKILTELVDQHFANSNDPITAQQLITGQYGREKYERIQPQLLLSADEFSDKIIEDRPALLKQIRQVAQTFARARESALSNTRMYLSMVGDLDVYIATSMRTRQDFRDMADFCERVFEHEKLQPLMLRYFDPTRSAAP